MSALEILKRLYAENDRITGRSPADVRLSNVLDEAALDEIQSLTEHPPAEPADAIEHLDVAAYCMRPSSAVPLIEAVARDCRKGAITSANLITLRAAISVCEASDHAHIASLLTSVLQGLRQPRLVG